MKRLANTYELENKERRLTPDEIRKSLSDFRFFMENFAQIVGKDRKLHPFKLNPFQEYLFSNLLPYIQKETRLERNQTIVIVKPRQVGCSTGFQGFVNYICSFLDDFQNTSIAIVLPVADTITKLYTKKVEPILTGVHPDLMPTMERETIGSSIITHYKDIKGVKRNNYLELVSAGANSIRSDTLNIVVFDEVAFYAHPDVVTDAALGSVPDAGFSLTVYMSTFEDRRNDFFLDKIKTAMDNPETHKVLFAPWFIMYPEYQIGIDYKDLELTAYDRNVIIPAMMEYKIPVERWGDCIDWYHKKSAQLVNVKKEFPTTLDEILEMGSDKKVFTEESLKAQEQNIRAGKFYRLITDNTTKKVEAQETDASPFRIFTPPQYGHKYKLVIDPITATNEDTDFFAMSVFDDANNEQVAVYHTKNMPIEDYADAAVAIAKIYNNALICPESNVADAIVVLIRSMGYYHFWYASPQARAKKEPGLRTTASSKELMIDKFKMMLERGSIIIRDEETLEELRFFEKKVKKHMGGGQTVKMAARKGKHDDLISCCWIYAGTLDHKQLTGRTSSGWSLM